MNCKSRYKAAAVVILAVAALVVITAFSASALGGPSDGGRVAAPARPAPSDFMKSTTLVLYSIKNGKVHKTVHTAAGLSAKPGVVVDGYVAGIVVLGETELDAYLDDTPLRKVSWQKDGTLLLHHFGRLNPKEMVVFDMVDADGSNRRAVNHYKRVDPIQGYSFFPKITGDAVSPEPRFSIDIVRNGERIAVSVRQTGYQDLLHGDPAPDDRVCRFRYLGDRIDTLNGIADYEDRIRAITAGIAEVEGAFQVRLVRNVNLVDCDGMQNALTRDGHDDIWFFVETIQAESVSELKVIARHETLHLLVGRYGFTRSTGIREIFADLKGYDELSLERFLLVTRGKSEKGPKTRVNGNDFFEFINEKNIFTGSKGGHSQDNLDEFCTSLLHALMFPDQIGQKLGQPISTGADRAPRALNSAEKRELLSSTRKMIQLLIGSACRSDGSPIDKFLETRLAHVEQFLYEEARAAAPQVVAGS